MLNFRSRGGRRGRWCRCPIDSRRRTRTFDSPSSIRRGAHQPRQRAQAERAPIEEDEVRRGGDGQHPAQIRGKRQHFREGSLQTYQRKERIDEVGQSFGGTS